MNLPQIIEPLAQRLPFKPLWYIYETIESYGIEIREIHLPLNQEGLYYQDDENRLIFISKSLDYFEKRTTSTHELIHALLHEKGGALYFMNNLWRDRFEYEARIYTARILIPQDKLLEMLKLEYPCFNIAEEFQVSVKLIQIALEDLERYGV